MKRVFLLLIFVFAIAAFASTKDNIVNSDEVQGQIKLLEKWITENMNYYHIPGMVVGVVYDQDLVWAQPFGVADLKSGEAMHSGHLFRIASISKTFTSIAIMQLRDAGQLRLDDPVKKYLKWFDIQNEYEHAPPVTLRQILTHTSGLPREAAFPYWTDHEFPTLEQIIETLPDQKMIYEPQTKWKYSNLAMALLGEIVAEVSGMPYENYIKRYILQPLQMKSTRVQLSESDKEKLATGYLRHRPGHEREVAPFTDSKGITAAANLTSGVDDLAKYIALQFRYENTQNDPVLRGSTLREMHRVHWLRPGWSSGWGLGFSISKSGDHVFVGHGGWVAGYRSQILFVPEEKIGVIVLINTEDFSPYKIAKKTFDLLADPISKATATEKEAPVFKAEWEKYVGKYMDTSYWETDVIIKNEKLYLYGCSYPPSDDPENSLTQLFYIAPHTFRMSGENGNGEKVVFKMDGDRVKQIKIGENFVYPVE